MNPMAGLGESVPSRYGCCSSRKNVVNKPKLMFWLNGCMGGRGRVKSAIQVVHSHGSIEVVLTKPRPSPLEQHCAGLPKACGN
jgi:hypothetical protein